ncbi:MAG: hypothetical protein M1837_003242 [Sclerophora amabilis]|nr:MAG: hypothetical protein M1837_003242 [Sclerophora amabilis]
MTLPFPIRSKNDPKTPDNLRDYNMLSPLDKDGSNYPCKGYNSDEPMRAVATYEAGTSYSMSLGGSATHGGGSCQLSLSYDNGKTFKVIKSMIGGCPITQKYDFTIPTFAKAGTALFVWTWFNLIGNREMYMNCARVQINNAASSPSGGSLDDLPDIYTANIGSKSKCQTVEGEYIVFPDPGDDVVYGDGLSESSKAALGTCPATGSGGSSSGGGNGGSGGGGSGGAGGDGGASEPSIDPPSTASAGGGAIPSSNGSPTTFSTVIRSSSPTGGEEIPSASPPSDPSASDPGMPAQPNVSSDPRPPTDGTSASSPLATDEPPSGTVPSPPNMDPSEPSPPSNTLPPTNGMNSSAPVVSDQPPSETASSPPLVDPAETLPPTPVSSQAMSGAMTMLPPSPFPKICTPNTPVCDPGETDGSWSLCSGLGDSLIPMGQMAAGTSCLPENRIGRARPDGDCTTEEQGMIRCGAQGDGPEGSSDMFLMCDDGGLVNMGAVAPGTLCVGGNIIAEPRYAGP